jgi:hypothetical protein
MVSTRPICKWERGTERFANGDAGLSVSQIIPLTTILPSSSSITLYNKSLLLLGTSIMDFILIKFLAGTIYFLSIAKIDG